MRKFNKTLSVLLAVLMLCVMMPAASLVTADTTNLFINGDFETGDSTGWLFYQSTAVDAASANNGGYGLHIVGNGGWGGLGNQTISGLEVGKTYRFSLYYKALANGVNIQLCEGTSDAGAKLAYTYGTKTEWTQFAVEFEATTATVFFTLVGAGNNIATEMYMDDITLTEVVLGGDDDDPNLKMIDTLVEDVKTQGRTAMVGGTLMLDFTVSGIEFELNCEGDVYATFNARKISSSSETGGVYFTIYVDGKAWARDYCRITSIGETKVLLASDLPAGNHTFAIYRQSEHSYGEVGVCALSYDGEMLDKPADKDLYIEFIGDSISCGFGNLGNGAVGDGTPLYSDGTQAYTFLTAQALDADWSTVSWSGLGCKYGYSTTTMQDVYPAQRYNYDQTTLYDFSKQPDVVILALGTNDNSIQSNATLKRAGLVEMLKLVREKNPNAPIVWIHGMMTTGVSTMIEEIVAEFGGAEAGYYACKLTQNNAGGGYHPNLVGQQKFAEELVAFLQENCLTEGEALGHDYTAATCTKAKTCKTCGATSGSKLGHSYNKVVTKATTTKNGTIKNVCTRCNYTASKVTTIYKASKVSLSKTSYTYNGKVQKPTVTVKDSAGNTIASSNYTVTYASGCKNAGTYKVTVTFKGNYSGTKTLTYKINPIDVSKCKITLSATSYTYNGSVKKPTVTVKNASGTKLTTSSYTVTYASGRKNVGTYKVTVKMKGNYTGTKTLTFKINPAKTTVSKLTAGSKKLTVAITKKSTQVTGYQIQYSTSKSFSSYKTKTLTSYKTTSATLTGLKAKTTYYVRVRTYKTVNGVKYYSGWSTIKYKKTK